MFWLILGQLWMGLVGLVWDKVDGKGSGEDPTLTKILATETNLVEILGQQL